MFSVIYLFEVKAGRSAQLEESWKELTELIYQYEGSLGSRLHKKNEQLYIAYAQWPSKEKWANSGNKLPEQSIHVRKKMRESCLKIETLHEMEVVDDLLKDKLYLDLL